MQQSTSKALSRFVNEAMLLSGNGFKKYRSERISYTDEGKISEFIIDETHTNQSRGNDYFWLWFAIELNNKSILDIYLSFSRKKHVFVAENFIQNLINKYGKHLVSTDMVVVLGILLCL
jgi:hypothetical protein